MIDLICRFKVFPILAVLCLYFGMSDWDKGISVSVFIILAALWGINWLLHHISPRWARYLRIGLLVIAVAAIVLVPELQEIVRTLINILFSALTTLTSPQLIALSILFLIMHAVLCWSRPAPQTTLQ